MSGPGLINENAAPREERRAKFLFAGSAQYPQEAQPICTGA